MAKRPSFTTFKAKALKKPAIKAEYEALADEFNLTNQLIKARKAAHVSQEEMAKKLSTKQPAIARLESGLFITASLITLKRYAEAIGYNLKITLVRKPHHPPKT